MYKGVDYSNRPYVSWDVFFGALKSAGYDVIGRYLSSYTKGLTYRESQSALEHGISIFPYFEIDTRTSLGGYKTGVQHAQQALYWLDELSIPTDTSVCYTVDSDMSYSELRGPVRDYFRGIASVVPLSLIGVYGGYYTVKYILEEGLASWAVQTEAWSYLDSNGNISNKGKLTWYPGAAARQWTIHASSHGTSYLYGVALDVLDVVGELPTYPGGDNDMTPEQDKLLRSIRVSEVARSYDVEIIKALQRGELPEIARLEKEKAEAVKKEKQVLGIA